MTHNPRRASVTFGFPVAVKRVSTVTGTLISHMPPVLGFCWGRDVKIIAVRKGEGGSRFVGLCRRIDRENHNTFVSLSCGTPLKISSNLYFVKKLSNFPPRCYNIYHKELLFGLVALWLFIIPHLIASNTLTEVYLYLFVRFDHFREYKKTREWINNGFKYSYGKNP